MNPSPATRSRAPRNHHAPPTARSHKAVLSADPLSGGNTGNAPCRKKYRLMARKHIASKPMRTRSEKRRSPTMPAIATTRRTAAGIKVTVTSSLLAYGGAAPSAPVESASVAAADSAVL